MNKREIWESTGIIIPSYLSFNELRKKMEEIEKMLSSVYFNFEVRLERDPYDNYYSHNMVYGLRYETDAEMNYRLSSEADEENHRKAQERAQYELLKKKFENE